MQANPEWPASAALEAAAALRRALQAALGDRVVLPLGQANPQIRRFLGTSENAARIQIAVALIAFLLLRLAQATQPTLNSPLAFARLVRTNLRHRRPLDRLLELEPPPDFNRLQMALQWNQSETGQP